MDLVTDLFFMRVCVCVCTCTFLCVFVCVSDVCGPVSYVAEAASPDQPLIYKVPILPRKKKTNTGPIIHYSLHHHHHQPLFNQQQPLKTPIL